MMKVLRAILEAEEPLVLTDGSAESMSHCTLDYIPGNKMLGAMAAKWIRMHRDAGVPDDSPEFRSLFLNGDVEWGHALPMAGKEPVVPVPVSYQKVKNHHGLPQEDSPSTDDCRVFNLAPVGNDETLREIARKKGCNVENATNLLAEVLRKEKLLDPDEKILKPKKLPAGFMGRDSLVQPSVRRRFDMHVAIGANRVAAEGLLYGYSAVCSGTRFSSDIFVHGDNKDAVAALVKKGDAFQVGHSRSAGYGTVRIVSADWYDMPESSDAGKGGSGWLFLLSGYVPAHSWEEPLDSLENEIRSDVPGFSFDRDQIFCRNAVLSSFNSLTRLPRRDRRILDAGSVLRYKCDAPFKLSPSYGGSRTEGYGRVENDPEFITCLAPLNTAKVHEIPHDPPAAPAKDQLTASAKSMIGAWRMRTLERIAKTEAAKFAASKECGGAFLNGYGRSHEHMTPSQIGNLRQMVIAVDPSRWLQEFNHVLEKDKESGPGFRWKNSTAHSPFDGKDDRFGDEPLSDIMKRLLDPSAFNDFALKRLSLEGAVPGGVPSGKELKRFLMLFQRLALFELIKAWERRIRTGSEGK